MGDERTPASLVGAASQGDQDAWDALVQRFGGLVWSIARGFRLADADAGDVFQCTWLKLVENLDGVRDPDRLGAWLATTARRECLRVLRRSGRAVPTDAELLDVVVADDDPPDAAIIDDERDRLLWRLVDDLNDRCRSLLRILMAEPAPTYDEVSAALQMPIGSIGPTRQRCLDKLRRAMEAGGITPGAEALF